MAEKLKTALGLKRDEIYRIVTSDTKEWFDSCVPKYNGNDCFCEECLEEMSNDYDLTREKRATKVKLLMEEYLDMLQEHERIEDERKAKEEEERNRNRLISEFNKRVQERAEEVRKVRGQQAKDWVNEEMTLGDIADFLRGASDQELIDFRELVMKS